MSLWNTVNMLCGKLPKGCMIYLCMENGSAWIEAIGSDGKYFNTEDLPDSTDRNIQEQLTDAFNTIIKMYGTKESDNEKIQTNTICKFCKTQTVNGQCPQCRAYVKHHGSSHYA